MASDVTCTSCGVLHGTSTHIRESGREANLARIAKSSGRAMGVRGVRVDGSGREIILRVCKLPIPLRPEHLERFG